MTAGAGISPAEVSLRVETAHDYAAVERLTREAFWNIYKPGCDEHYLLHILRDSPGYLPDLHLLALWRGEIIGNIVYSRAHVVDEAQHRHPVLCFGPLGVRPAHQRQGIGSLLVSHSLEKARSLGERAVLIFGHPGYYQRFGFGPAASYGIATKGGQQFDQFMALPLFAGVATDFF